MKYIIILCDGMADYPLSKLNGKTPMEAAYKPNMDFLASKGEIGLVKTVADGMSPGSDVANMTVLGFDPKKYYTGRSPLEAASIGIDMLDTDVSLRCNLVTLSEEPDYSDKTMVDYCADDISTAEAAELVEAVQNVLGADEFKFYCGVSYRHCLLWANGTTELGCMTPPHDITGKPIKSHLSSAANAAPLIDLMKKSYDVLKNHPINLARIAEGKRPANSIWLWGEGKRPALPPFESLLGIKGAIVSAVDLLKGIGRCAKMDVAKLYNATGYIDTDFDEKASAALALLETNDLVYIHVEAPDECGHRGEMANKIRAIELIDEKVIHRMLEGVKNYDEWRIMILPDHPTPLSLMTHTADSVPYLIYDNKHEKQSSIDCFSEKTAAESGVYIEDGATIIRRLISNEK